MKKYIVYRHDNYEKCPYFSDKLIGTIGCTEKCEFANDIEVISNYQDYGVEFFCSHPKDKPIKSMVVGTIKSDWSFKLFCEQMRLINNNPDGSIVITKEQQDEVCNLLDMFYVKKK
jgi:hypothetical protein